MNAFAKIVNKAAGRVNKIRCSIGFHDWRSDSDIIPSTIGKGDICLVWWVCDRCAHSKVKCILR
jgi:hypothetical protein